MLLSVCTKLTHKIILEEMAVHSARVLMDRRGNLESWIVPTDLFITWQILKRMH